MVQCTQFQTISLLYEEAGFLLTWAEQNWAGVLEVESEQQAQRMPSANPHPRSLISQQLAVLRSGEWGGRSGCSEKNMITQSWGSWCSALWLLVACQEVQRQRRTKQQDWDLSLSTCFISVFCKSIFFGMAPKITSPWKEEKWVSQHIPATVSILRTWKYQYSTVNCDSSYWVSKNRKY